MPDFSFKKQSPYPLSVVAWVDLLGYGSQIAKAKFDLTNEHSIEATQRIRRFHKLCANHSARNFPSLVINDGCAFYRDLSLRTNSVTYDFLRRSYAFFRAVQNDEAFYKMPGARMVIAAGFRSRGRKAGDDPSAGQLNSILKRMSDGKISSEQAVREAARMPRKLDVVPQLQANYAFTKAYVAESSGQAGGFSGACLFVDTTLFQKSEKAVWIKMGSPFSWADPARGLKGEFSVIEDFEDHGNVDPAPVFYRSGLQVAEKLSPTPDFLARIHEAIRGATSS